ncbi:hypothetical protein ASG43_18675 [Aureimonas sp. Leaf454]|uniref:hypothetical protein n=1 Tax=Aureimonas sp. Leaf454 TaxID=1736381 RepID=UPI0006F70545|nr:hypothetical protein [Aureimonas sp. Leaf454]KQT53247.1 hypothetical protein ASG43_18675 [Aureimonas sp. Leaf454]
MGLIFAVVLLAGMIWLSRRSLGLVVTMVGWIVFVLGLAPIAVITSFHPYMAMAILQTVTMQPTIAVGILLLGVGRLLRRNERETGASV